MCRSSKHLNICVPCAVPQNILIFVFHVQVLKKSKYLCSMCRSSKHLNICVPCAGPQKILIFVFHVQFLKTSYYLCSMCRSSKYLNICVPCAGPQNIWTFVRYAAGDGACVWPPRWTFGHLCSNVGAGVWPPRLKIWTFVFQCIPMCSSGPRQGCRSRCLAVEASNVSRLRSLAVCPELVFDMQALETLFSNVLDENVGACVWPSKPPCFPTKRSLKPRSPSRAPVAGASCALACHQTTSLSVCENFNVKPQFEHILRHWTLWSEKKVLWRRRRGKGVSEEESKDDNPEVDRQPCRS